MEQINNIRTLVGLNFIKIEDAEIQKNIEKIKKYKRANSNERFREESKNNINKLFSTNLKKEESITTDFEKLKNNNNKNENSQKRNKKIKYKK